MTNGCGTRFAIIGVAGYIARRHIEAIRQSGGELVAAYDVFDSVGQMNVFANARFFTELSEFSSYINFIRCAGQPIDYISICSPNHLHRAHIEFALRHGAHAICEKPVVLDPSEFGVIERIERETGRRVFSILQLRLNPENQKLCDEVRSWSCDQKILGELTYVTARGRWYFGTWKGDERKSGGVATNIGVHLYDLLTYLFGDVNRIVVHHREIDCVAGVLEFEHAKINWFLSVNSRDLQSEGQSQSELNKATRSLRIRDKVFDLSGDFTNLHTASYQEILSGRGFGLEVARPAIEIASKVRLLSPQLNASDAHPALKQVLADRERYEDGFPT